MAQAAIPYMQIRGGSSKGLYFHAHDLPSDRPLRDRVLIAAMCGIDGNDPRQIDGLGGGDPLASKVAIIGPSDREDADLEYEFVQVIVGKNGVDRTQNCGNILAGVVPFAIESSLIKPVSPSTRVRVYMLNSRSVCEVTVPTTVEEVVYSGEAKIDGVLGTAAPILCNYLDTAGSACGELFPTGNKIDRIEGIEVTCIDNGMPIIVIRAADIGKTGYEMPEQLNADSELKKLLERIRLQLGPRMNLGDVEKKVVPKMCLIAPPLHHGIIHSRTFIPHVCHTAIGVLGAVTLATACLIPATVAQPMAVLPKDQSTGYSVEHPSGEFSIVMEVEWNGDDPVVRKAGVIRTARLLSRGCVMIPEGVLSTS